MVSARSVKLLDRINNSEEPETRDNWWTEIRMEVRSHARALGCTVILGYEEHTSIWYFFLTKKRRLTLSRSLTNVLISEEVCVLSASGTAAVVKLQPDVDFRDTDHKRESSKTEV